MNTQFLYKDGQGSVVDEHRVEPMDLVVDEELFAIETVSSCTQFLMNKPPERPFNTSMQLTIDEKKSEDIDIELRNKRCYTFYSDDKKTRFFFTFF